jgi:hypothetical protein
MSYSLVALLTAASALSVPPAGAVVPPVVTVTVATGAARSLGEPVAVQDPAVSAVVATSFGPAGARALAWTRRAGEHGWAAAGAILPDGFGSSYDASATAVPGGPLLVVAGTAPPGESCIDHGSVAIATVGSDGRLGPARLVSDQRGTGSFDDRPAVAAGTGGMVWVAWSQGGNADACQDVGTSDRIEVAASRDGGVNFGSPVALPSAGGVSAFGARLAPLGSGRVAASWTEQMGNGAEAVLVSVLGTSGVPSPPRQVLAGDPPPLVLPGASFYDFPAGDVAVAGGTLVVAVPLWRSGHAVIALATGTLNSATGTPDEQWLTSAVSPPAGADLLLPALARAGPGRVRLLCAAHWRAGDRLGYESADLSVPRSSDGPAPAAALGGLVPATPAPSGPGFYEIGEEISLAPAPGGLLASVVVAGEAGARVQTLAWRTPAAPAAPVGPSAKTSRPSAAAPAGTAARAAASHAAARGWTGRLTAAWTAAALFLLAAALSAWRLRRRRAARR